LAHERNFNRTDQLPVGKLFIQAHRNVWLHQGKVRGTSNKDFGRAKPSAKSCRMRAGALL